MSLTSFVRRPDVVQRLKPFRPKGKRTLPVERRADPRTKHYTLVGVAFDYLLRFEIQRRSPHAESSPWVADGVVDRLRHESADGNLVVESPIMRDGSADPSLGIDPVELIEIIQATVEDAKVVHAEYLQMSDPSRNDRERIAVQTLRLAHLDGIVRSRHLSPEFQTVDQGDVDDLVELLSVAPATEFASGRRILLNPILGHAAPGIGGADADLVADDLLVEVKTTSKPEIKSDYLDQLLGYFILSTRAEVGAQPFPELKSIGIYFSRHGHLWQITTDEWTQHPDFQELVDWFFDMANGTGTGG